MELRILIFSQSSSNSDANSRINLSIKVIDAKQVNVPENITELNQIPHNLVLPIAQKLLDAIKNEETSIPTSKGDQVLLASRIAATCKDLGFEGELGYDLFMYPNEVDLRNVLLFLTGKLAHSQKKISFSESKDGLSSLMRNISLKINEELEKPWMPSYCETKGFNISSDGIWTRSESCMVEPFLSNPFKITRDSKSVAKAFAEYWRNAAPNSIEPEVSITLENSLIQADDILNKLRSKNSFNINIHSFGEEKLEDTKVDQDEDVCPEGENVSNIIDVQSLDTTVYRDNEEKDKILHGLFANSENNAEKIKLLEERVTEQIIALKEKIDDKKNRSPTPDNEKIIENKFIDENVVLENAIKKKADKLQKAKKNKLFFSLTPDKERIIHTNDVVETIDHLQKLKVEMNKIIQNINTTQKEINNINGVLERSFVVADELIFKDAKKDEFARKTYKLIANVHTECDELCNTVKEIGVFTRDTVAIEKNVETMQRKNTKENLERATEDLKAFSRKINQ